MPYIRKLNFVDFFTVFLSCCITNCADDILPDAGTFYYLDAKKTDVDSTNIQIMSCYFDCARDSQCQSVQSEDHSNKCRNLFSKDGQSEEDGSPVSVWTKDKKVTTCLARKCYGDSEEENQGTTEELQPGEVESNQSNVEPNSTEEIQQGEGENNETSVEEEEPDVAQNDLVEDGLAQNRSNSKRQCFNRPICYFKIVNMKQGEATAICLRSRVSNEPEDGAETEPVVESGFNLRRRRQCYRRRRIYHCSDYRRRSDRRRRRRRRNGDAWRRRTGKCKTVYFGRRRIVCSTS